MVAPWGIDCLILGALWWQDFGLAGAESGKARYSTGGSERWDWGECWDWGDLG